MVTKLGYHAYFTVKHHNHRSIHTILHKIKRTDNVISVYETEHVLTGTATAYLFPGEFSGHAIFTDPIKDAKKLETDLCALGLSSVTVIVAATKDNFNKSIGKKYVLIAGFVVGIFSGVLGILSYFGWTP